MEAIKVCEVARETCGTLLGGDPDACFPPIGTDTRTLKRGEVFMALAGKRCDGNGYLEAAVGKGCGGLVFSRSLTSDEKKRWKAEGLILIRVRDTLAALHSLTRWYRKRFPLPAVAVTGSNGKTTTKEMLAKIASRRYKVLASERSFNNQFGVPLTLLKLESRHSLMVMELGMNAPGEIRKLAELIAPTVGVVTNIGPAHLRFLGDLEGVAAAKAELFDVMAGLDRGNESPLMVINNDDPYCKKMKKRYNLRARTFGLDAGSDVFARDLEFTDRGMRFRMTFCGSGDTVDVGLPLWGEHNVLNALAASAVAECLGVSPCDIAEALALVRRIPMRMEPLIWNGVTVINDAYNANPASLRAAVDTFCRIPSTGRRGVVVGDMLELGRYADDAHREAGRYIAEAGLDYLVAVGEYAGQVRTGAVEGGMQEEKALAAGDLAEAAVTVRRIMRAGDAVLMKASRSVGLEKLLGNVKG
jgi:UDP-N-acetylmuramoyl-tripeptide--D-alanyl-D-alanine ligase